MTVPWSGAEEAFFHFGGTFYLMFYGLCSLPILSLRLAPKSMVEVSLCVTTFLVQATLTVFLNPARLRRLSIIGQNDIPYLEKPWLEICDPDVVETINDFLILNISLVLEIAFYVFPLRASVAILKPLLGVIFCFF